MSSYSDTPIAEAAERASRIIHRMDLDDLPRPAFRRMLSVANQKGGVGKTTSAVNLAAALGLYGMRVLVVDLDPQGNASTALGAEHRSGTPSSYELLLGDCKLEECVQKSTAGENVFVVPATIDLAGSEIELVGMVARENRLKDALDDDYLDELDVDFVFIDCPPSLGLLTINSMVAANEILLPIQCEYYALEGVETFITHPRGGDISPDSAAQMANQVDGDLMITMECDVYPNDLANGVATFFFRNSHGKVSAVGKLLAQFVQREVVARTGLTDCRSHGRTWDVLRLTRMPSICASLGYITNKHDRELLLSAEGRDAIAEGIVVAVKRLYLMNDDTLSTGSFTFAELLEVERKSLR
jgi:cellulose biosynthesis protein BcsQ